MGRDRDVAKRFSAANKSKQATMSISDQGSAVPQPQWASWVPGVIWLEENTWDRRIPKEIVQKYRPASTASSGGRCKLTRPGRIMDSAHPAFDQFGLFAAKKLSANEHVLDYRGLVTLEEHESRTSDYTLTFVDDSSARLTLDAEKCGNEARFINDYRGTGMKANVKFQERWDKNGNIQMGVYVLPNVTIPKNAELLLSYGKGYWLARTGYKEPAVDDNGAVGDPVVAAAEGREERGVGEVGRSSAHEREVVMIPEPRSVVGCEHSTHIDRSSLSSGDGRSEGEVDGVIGVVKELSLAVARVSITDERSAHD